PAGPDVIHLAGRFDDSGRSLAIRPLDRRYPLRERSAGPPAVRGGAGDRAEVDVAGCREHLDPVLPPLAVGPAIDGLEETLEDPAHEVVGVLVVVAVFAGLVEQPQTEQILSRKIRV